MRIFVCAPRREERKRGRKSESPTKKESQGSSPARPERWEMPGWMRDDGREREIMKKKEKKHTQRKREMRAKKQ